MGAIDNSRKAVYGYDQRLEVFCSNGTAMANNEVQESVTVRGNQAGFLSAKPPYFFMQRYAPSYAEEVREFVEMCSRRQADTYNRSGWTRRRGAGLRGLEVIS